LIDFAINLAILFVLMLWYGYMLGWQILCLPCFVALAMLASLGPAFLITALNVKYRDFRYIITFLVQFGLYVSPVGFSSAIVPDRWRFWYSLNPVVGVIDGFRWCILCGTSPLYWPGFLLSIAVVAFFLAGHRLFPPHGETLRGSDLGVHPTPDRSRLKSVKPIVNSGLIRPLE
jgi:lipopolysaccharide transport system permease protein